MATSWSRCGWLKCEVCYELLRDLPSELLGGLMQIDGTDSMEAVFETINEAIEGVRRVPHSV